ncbi:MAG: VanW family protein [Patescibacteria group bacterium]
MGGETKKTVWGRVVGLYRSTKPAIKYSAWTLSVVAVLALGYLGFSLRYLDRVYPNVVIGSNQFQGMTREQLTSELTKLTIAQGEQKIILRQGEETLEFSSKDIDWQVDLETTANQIFGYGREDTSRLISFFHQLRSAFIKTHLDPVSNYDEDLLAAKVSQIADKINNPAINASAELVSDKLVTTTEKSGEVVDEANVTNQALAFLNSFTGGTITIEKRLDTPTIVLGNVDELTAKLELLSVRQLTLKWATGNKKLNRKEIRQLVGYPPAGGGQTSESASPKFLTVAFTAEKVQNYLTGISDQTDSPAAEPQLVIKDGQLAIVKASKIGTVVDLAVSAEAILGALEGTDVNPTIELTMKTQTPTINEANLATLGIKERIGYGETSFAGSPANRRHNITNGVSILQSALIKPGETFSTIAKLGAIDNTTGYLPELVIKENRTTPEFGGGLCQVSTTLFRAMMNAGLPVTERKNHSYRVSYYEPPVGLDATIYFPKPDLKFVNDTPGYILIQGRVVGSKVQFEFWGTSDGRTSSITAPIVSNIIQPGEPIYADTDTLPKGEQKQIEKPHAGATAVVTYTVTRAGQVINKQVFKSVYKVWPARFLVGTNESLLPTNPPTP